MSEIYFDNSATTAVCDEAIEKAVYMMKECWGNPSSLHSRGFDAEKEVTAARNAVAKRLGCESREIYFTSGGTECNNLAVFGAVEAKKRLGKRIVTTAIEHPSVLEPMKQLEKQGYEVIYLMPDEKGNIPEEAVFGAITKDTILVSMMAVNNETGAILPIKAAASAIKRAKSPALLHVDNVQGFGKIKLVPKRMGIDLMSISSHKVHGPKGVGALYVASGVRILPRTFGGGQEKMLRPGTEAVPAICAFGAASENLGDEKTKLEKVERIRDLLKDKLEKIEGIVINSPDNGLPYVLNFSAGKIRSETMLHFLEAKEIYVSSGSACSKSKPSHVLEAMGLSKERIDSSIRVSFSKYNSEDQVEPFAEAIAEAMQVLAHR